MELKLKERFWTIPNVLSLYRIVVFPLVLYFIIDKQERLFAVFITINLLTDILDGFIARRFNMQTAIGALLDSYADFGTYILAFIAIYIFKWNEIKPHKWMFIIFFIVMLLSYAVVFIKFKRLIGLHTYLFKASGYLQGAFIILLFMNNFNVFAYYVCLIWGTVACIEELIIIALLKKPASNVKGLYWVLRNNLHK